MTTGARGVKTKGNSIFEICRALKRHERFLLAPHVNPEGDAIGSALAMESLLRRMGKKTLVVCEDPFPERLRCLPDRLWNQAQDVGGKQRFDALVVVDCPLLERVGKVRDLITPETKIFNIDHHISNSRFGHYNYICPEAAACGEVVYDIFKHFKMKLTKEEAAALYIAISTDTGSFKYSNTTVKSHQIAAALIQTGIDIEKINDELYATYSLEKIQLYSLLLGKVRTASKGRVAWVELTRQDLERTGGTYEDTEGFIDFLKYLKEVQFAFFLSQLNAPPPGKVRVSFRSKGDYDVSQIAASFGGGGHKKAAGCTFQGTLEEAVQGILKRIDHDLERFPVKTTDVTR